MNRPFDYVAERAYYAKPPDVLRDVAWLEGHFQSFGDYQAVFRDKRVLDIGAGECIHGRFVATRCVPRLYVNLDLFADRMQLAMGTPHPKQTAFVVGDGFHLPFRRSAFDVVFISGVLFRLRPLEPIVAEIARVLAPSGTFVGIEPNFVSPVMELRRAIMRRTNPNDGQLKPEEIRAAFATEALSCEIAFFWRRYPGLTNQWLARQISPTIRIFASRPR